MQASHINYLHTGFFSKTLTDYLSNCNNLSDFYKYQPSIDSFKQIIADKSVEKIDRSVLVDVLHKQYQSIGNGPWTKAIDSLGSSKTFTVTTGHQLCLATGPLYFIYKIVTTIKLAREIEQAYPAYKIVPVYWMATEDHDFEEINHFNLFGRKFSWELDAKGATGRLSTQTLNPLIDELKSVLGQSENAMELNNLIENAYLKHNNLADATRYLVNELFGQYGLVIIDADEASLKKQFIPIIKRDISEQHSHQLVNETIIAFEQTGAHIQVKPREINFFYLEDELRERIVFENNRYTVLNTDISFSKEELEKEIENHPEKFSPNVIMRALYEESVLPNLAYIGGGAEVGYWMEFKSTFDFYKINFPMLVLRNSALIVDETSKKRLIQLGLEAKNLFTETNKLIDIFVKQQSVNELNLDSEIQKFEKAFVQLSLKAQNIDPTLAGSVEAEKAKFFNSLKGLESKLAKAEKKKFEQQTGQIVKVKDKLFPNGSLQERVDNFMPYYLKQGNGFIEMLMENFDPLDFQFTVFE
ncbi:bacillithiol biosynthesis cysteine-adding enzyme BshC [Solitalea lacus]|uniref:bacillithiol biosynthesis cysteine-adding enzyme BshC n=1 Tax=Solitalea lacus TaxID=2911172 RepID=UPI001EDB9394|nr:bacillithiol biosynthesis cysteine-adding enzyme BshC [Solitalea lacus]UKJ06980.1 bacillithiol biosynthesis cysteine-adding enzyme BshC [Solitalea lacus]